MDDPDNGWRTHRGHEPPESPLSRRQLLIAGAAVVGTVGFWAASSKRGGGSGAASTRPASASTSPDVVTPAPSTMLAAPSAAVPIPELDHDLAKGMAGAEVQAMQALLAGAGFDPGPIDGIFGGATIRSVWAFEKLVLGTPREQARGVVTPEIWHRMNEPLGVGPRRTPGGTHLEVYLPEQVAVIFESGAVRVISHVSSGEGITWCDEVEIDNDDGTTSVVGICGQSITPGGVYHFERKVEGWRKAKLGRLYNPVYFNFGIAIHGAGNVPDYPASRGCVRFPMHIAEYFQDIVSIGDAVYVFDGVEEPEVYGAQPMIFDYPDPDWVPPSTSTTTTSTSTTTPATTTAPAPTTPATTATTSTTTTSTTTTPTTTAPAQSTTTLSPTTTTAASP